jgi:hypothetical protein
VQRIGDKVHLNKNAIHLFHLYIKIFIDTEKLCTKQIISPTFLKKTPVKKIILYGIHDDFCSNAKCREQNYKKRMIKSPFLLMKNRIEVYALVPTSFAHINM